MSYWVIICVLDVVGLVVSFVLLPKSSLLEDYFFLRSFLRSFSTRIESLVEKKGRNKNHTPGQFFFLKFWNSS